MAAELRIGVDTGGTFTDFIAVAGSRVRVHKVPSTPENPAHAILQGIADLFAGGAPVFDLLHGSTVATNALLTRRGEKTALVTTAGFEDVIEIGRQTRKELYDLAYRRPAPLVPRRLRFGAAERCDERGEVLEPLQRAEVRRLAALLRKADVKSVAICFLHSYANPAHEDLVAAALRKSGVSVSVSSRVLPEYREFERTSTTCVNAYVSPLMARYLGELERKSGARRLRVMQSNGGVISAGTAATEAVRTILSGPAGGVVGAFEVARRAGFENVITFDMGGTSTDVSLLKGRIGFTAETEVAGCPIRVPVIDIHTVGAGGGSIARKDPGGALAVGPESAGADPGPLCYGKGKDVTVTDAHLYLGRLDPDRFLGGKMRLDTARAKKGIEKLAAELKLSPTAAAEGVLRVADQHMAGAIRLISLERGHDPRDFTLVCFGGAGGMHAFSLARVLDIPEILIPRDPGILSARGMVLADVVKDYARTVLLPGAAADRLGPAFSALEAQARKDLRAEGFARIRRECFADMRYAGQSYELTVPLKGKRESRGALLARFHRMHEARFATSSPDRPVEIVTLRLRAAGRTKKPPLPAIAGGGKDARAARAGSGRMIFEGKAHRAARYARDLLKAGDRFTGPALVTEFSATTVVPPGAACRVDEWGNLLLRPGAGRRRR